MASISTYSFAGASFGIQGDGSFDEPALTDQTLVTAAKIGDQSAFEQLFARHYRFCMAKAYSILRDRYDAEDEVQNAYTKAWQHLDQYQHGGSFGGWLSRIVSNQCLMRIRDRRGAQMVSVDEVFDTDGTYRLEVIDQRELPEEAVGGEEVARVLRRELQRVPPLLRTVLEMKDVELMDMRAIAEKLDISVPAAKSRLKRARNELRQRLEKYCGSNAGGTLRYNSMRRRAAYVRAA